MAVAVPIALVVAGTLMQAKAQADMRKRQDKLSGAMSDYQRTKYGEGRTAIETFLKGTEPEAKAAERQQLTDELGTGYNQSVSAARAVEAPQTVAGAVSPDYTARVASNEGDLASRLKRAVSQLSIIGAPGQQGLAEARRFGIAGGQVDATNSAANNVGAAYMRGIQSQRPNGNLMLLGSLMQAAGMAGAGAGAFGAAGAAGAGAGAGGMTAGGLSTTGAGLGLGAAGAYGLRPSAYSNLGYGARGGL